MGNRERWRPSVVAGLLGSAPALVLVVGAVLSWREYFFLTYAIVSVAHLALSFAAGLFAPRHTVAARSWKQVALLAFRDLAFAWGAAMVLLAILNLTPLCVGIDSGDGLNSVGDCVVQSVAVVATCTLPILGLAGLAAVGLGRRLGKVGNTAASPDR